METLTRNTSGRHGDVPVKAQSSSLQRRVLAVLLSIFRHMRLSFCAFERLRLSNDMERFVIIQLITFLVLNTQNCSQLHFMAFICCTYPIHFAISSVMLKDSLRPLSSSSIYDINAVSSHSGRIKADVQPVLRSIAPDAFITVSGDQALIASRICTYAGRISHRKANTAGGLGIILGSSK